MHDESRDNLAHLYETSDNNEPKREIARMKLEELGVDV
jgi:hypothetical protein